MTTIHSKIPAALLNMMSRLKDTGRMHKNKEGKGICKIFTLAGKETKYSGTALCKLRAERGVGNIRKIQQGA